MRTLATVIAAAALCGCAVNPSSPRGAALEPLVRIAVRHAVLDSPRAAAKADNIRAVVTRLQRVATADTTLGALKAEVRAEIDRLQLTPIQRDDALDLLDTLGALIESRVGGETFDTARAVKVQEFLMLVLSAIPSAGATAYRIETCVRPCRTHNPPAEATL